MALNFSDLQAERFADDLHRAATYKPILRSDLKKAYSRYKDVGVKLGRVKNKTDAQLYRMATQDVLAWWKKTRKDQKASSAKPTTSLPKPTATPVSGGGSGGSSGSNGSSGNNGNSGGGNLLPNTALPRGSSAGSGAPLPNIPEPLNQSYMNQMLERAGFAGATPPSYALRNKDTFDAWLRRAIAYAQRSQAVAVKTPTGTKVTTVQQKAGNRNPVIR